jgi:ATP-dependent RNA helicase DeaD
MPQSAEQGSPERGRGSHERRERRESPGNLVPWRIAVGKRHRVEPRQIVGALANEGGLKRSDFGRINILPGFSIVELPADLSADTLERLTTTRISGVLIDLRRDAGPERPGSRHDAKGSRAPGKKPRHKAH